MFNVPIEKIKKGNPEYALRAKGKVAELALGYQGGTGALIQMGALRMGLTEEELPDIVHRWRTANKRIQDFWYTVENCAIETVTLGNNKPDPAWDHVYERCRLFYDQTSFRTMLILSRSTDRRELHGEIRVSHTWASMERRNGRDLKRTVGN